MDETTETAKEVGTAGTGGVGPLIRAKSKFVKLADITSSNGRERELHPIVDYKASSEPVDDTTPGSKVTSKIIGVEKGTTATEDNK